MDLLYSEVDIAYESVFCVAMEAVEKKLLNTNERNELPDECFGIIYTNDKGKLVRAYPLCVPGDKKKTAQLLQKSIDMFHYCLPKNKEKLAKKIIEIATQEKVKLTMNERNQILKFVDPDEIPSNITIIKKDNK